MLESNAFYIDKYTQNIFPDEKMFPVLQQKSMCFPRSGKSKNQIGVVSP